MWYIITAPAWLWVFFLAVMKLQDVRDAGELTGFVRYPAYAVLAVALVLNALVNWTWATIWFREWPPRQKGFPYIEAAVSKRTKRWAEMDEDSFNRRSARVFRKVMLARFDSTGRHS